MLIGCCANMLATENDPVGMWAIDTIVNAGFDYIDLPVAEMMALSDGEFLNLRRHVKESGITCRGCNNFVPSSFRLTGNVSPLQNIKEYLERSLDRVAELGAGLVCFGSSGARNVPDGFPRDDAWKQLVDFLQTAGETAARKGITIVIEHLNRSESNIVNSVAEGIRLSRDAGSTAVRVLVDYYHLALEKESCEIISDAGELVLHCHIANPRNRVFPAADDGHDYGEFFDQLRNICYTGGVSLEAFTEDLQAEAAATCEFLKKLGKA